jgi:hypothetical protein
LKRFERKTLGYSKSLEMHKLAFALHFGVFSTALAVSFVKWRNNVLRHIWPGLSGRGPELPANRHAEAKPIFTLVAYWRAAKSSDNKIKRDDNSYEDREHKRDLQGTRSELPAPNRPIGTNTLAFYMTYIV